MLQSLPSRGALTATTAIVAVGLLFMTPGGQELLRPNEVPRAPLETSLSDTSAPQAERDAPDLRAGETELAEETAPAPLGIVAQESRSTQADLGGPALSSEALAPAPLRLADEPAAPGFETGTETFPQADPNPLRITAEDPVSTFSIDVDTASYAVVRSSLAAGRLPPPDAVRIEEMVNYFPYDLPAPDSTEAPFETTLTVMETPWNADTQLLHIGIQGTLPAVADRPPLNLVFLVDTSGSMQSPDKLPLLVQSLGLMLGQLTEDDEIAIVTYAGQSGVLLPPTPATELNTIRAALQTLTAGGSTAGQAGLETAYGVAEAMTAEGEVTRVILATDGDFNVGLSDPSALEDFIADKRDSGTYLSVLGFGRGNLDDATLQALAQVGNGQAAYIDTLSEAQKVLVDQLTGALFPIADDVKVQVEFNPATVAEYRLIGYETRTLNREDFNNDAVDAGELGAGHSVTALYEITPVGSPAVLNDPLRYAAQAPAEGPDDEVGLLRLRYTLPGEEESRLLESVIGTATAANTEAAFAAAIAGFGELLRGSEYLGDWTFADAHALAVANRGDDPFGYRSEALGLIRLAESLSQ